MILEMFEGERDQEGDSKILNGDQLFITYRIDVCIAKGLKLLLDFFHDCLNSMRVVIPEVLIEEIPVEFDKKPQDWCLMLNQCRTVGIEGLDHLSQR